MRSFKKKKQKTKNKMEKLALFINSFTDKRLYINRGQLSFTIIIIIIKKKKKQSSLSFVLD